MTAQGTLRRGQAHRAVWTRGQYEQGAKGRPPQAGRASVARALRSDLSRSAEGAVGAKQSPGRHHRACGPSVEGSGGLTGRMVRGQPAARELVPVVLEEWQSAAVLSRVPVAAPARRFAGRRVGALTPASAGYGKFSRHQRGSGTVLSKQAGRKLVLGDLSECGHIAVIRNPRCTSWQSRKPRELLISSRLPLPARITITKTWGG